MNKLMYALLKRLAPLTAAFVVGVSAYMLYVYQLPIEQLGSTRYGLAQAKQDVRQLNQDVRVWWYQPFAFKVFVPQQDDPNRIYACKPNPLTLVISVDDKRLIQLNGKEIGSLEDTEKLQARLIELFQERVKFKAYRENIMSRPDFDDLPESEKTEKTVYIKAHHSLKYGEVLKLIDDVKGAGADPIGLQIDKHLFFAPAENTELVTPDSLERR